MAQPLILILNYPLATDEWQFKSKSARIIYSNLFFTIHRERRDGAMFEKDASRGAWLRAAGGGRAQTFGRFRRIFLVTEVTEVRLANFLQVR